MSEFFDGLNAIGFFLFILGMGVGLVLLLIGAFDPYAVASEGFLIFKVAGGFLLIMFLGLLIATISSWLIDKMELSEKTNQEKTPDDFDEIAGE